MNYAIGLDIGATKVAAGIVNLDSGQVEMEIAQPTNSLRGGAAVLRDCVELAKRLADDRTDAVGIGLCELVDKDGRPQGAHTFDWRTLDIATAFAPLRVVVDSDVRAAARAEAVYGAGDGFNEFLYLSVGSGVSYCLVVEDEPRLGAHGNAIIVGAPPVERVASGRALAATAGVERAEEVLADEAYDPIVQRAAEQLGLALATLVLALDPDGVVIGGGLGLVNRYHELVKQSAVDAIHAAEIRAPAVVPAALGAASGVIGAALTAAGHSRRRRSLCRRAG
jgi:glucokinase